MKTLTQNQQLIIESLTSEFLRINNEHRNEGSFNLINIDPLMQKTMEIKQNKREAEMDYEAWHNIAMQEAERIVQLLRQDLPNACVERYGESNGKYDAPSVLIQRKKGRSGHHENYVSIDVVVKKEAVYQSHGCDYKKGVSLLYRHNDNLFNSIEELFEKSSIADEIRIKILR